MEKFEVFTGVGAPLRRSNVDTDQIIPAVYLKRITKTGFEDALFAAWRNDPEFVLNQDAYKNAEVLVAGPDFGTGSSREHAVWALRDYGFKCVLSSKFADIFRGNSGKQGLIAGEITDADTEKLWAALEANPGASITINLVEHPLMNGLGLTGNLLVMDMAALKLAYMDGRDTVAEHYGMVGTSGNAPDSGQDAQGGSLLSELAVELINPAACALVTGLTSGIA